MSSMVIHMSAMVLLKWAYRQILLLFDINIGELFIHRILLCVPHHFSVTTGGTRPAQVRYSGPWAYYTPAPSPGTSMSSLGSAIPAAVV